MTRLDVLTTLNKEPARKIAGYIRVSHQCV